jgi:hypothetical protein
LERIFFLYMHILGRKGKRLNNYNLQFMVLLINNIIIYDQMIYLGSPKSPNHVSLPIYNSIVNPFQNPSLIPITNFLETFREVKISTILLSSKFGWSK